MTIHWSDEGTCWPGGHLTIEFWKISLGPILLVIINVNVADLVCYPFLWLDYFPPKPPCETNALTGLFMFVERCSTSIISASIGQCARCRWFAYDTNKRKWRNNRAICGAKPGWTIFRTWWDYLFLFFFFSLFEFFHLKKKASTNFEWYLNPICASWRSIT